MFPIDSIDIFSYSPSPSRHLARFLSRFATSERLRMCPSGFGPWQRPHWAKLHGTRQNRNGRLAGKPKRVQTSKCSSNAIILPRNTSSGDCRWTLRWRLIGARGYLPRAIQYLFIDLSICIYLYVFLWFPFRVSSVSTRVFLSSSRQYAWRKYIVSTMVARGLMNTHTHNIYKYTL